MARRKRAEIAAQNSEFSTKSIDLTRPTDATYMRSVVATTRYRSMRGWQWYRDIGEIHYAVSRGAKIAGYTTLKVVKRNPDGTPGKEITSGAEAAVLPLLQSPYGGQRGLVERFFTLMKIPGDAYLIRCRDDEGDIEGYDWLSADEIDRGGLGDVAVTGDRDPIFKADQQINRIILPASDGNAMSLMVPVQAQDFIGRVWRPAGQYVALADSPMRSLDMECELLDLLTKNIRAKLLSRFALNGVFFVPSEIATIRSGEPSGKANEQFHDNSVLDRLIAAATWAVQNHEQPEAAVPIFMSGPGQYADMIRHITADREIMDVDMKLRAELLDRILMGLDTQKTSVTGSQDSNHWSAWASGDEERRVNIQPDIETMCWALTRMVLWRELENKGIPAGRISNCMVWYDMSGASAKSNLAEDARQLRDRLLVGDSAARRLSGVAETDAPAEDEYVRMVGLKTQDPYLATFGLPVAERIDWDKVKTASKPGPDPQSKPDEAPVGPGVGEPGSPDNNDSDTPRSQRPA